MIAVIDASAALNLALNRAESGRFKALVEEADILIAPDIYPAEITNAFWKYARFAHVESAACETGIDCCIDLVDDFIPTRLLCREAFAESLRYSRPAYELFYLTLARRQNAILATADASMRELAQSMNVRVA